MATTRVLTSWRDRTAPSRAARRLVLLGVVALVALAVPLLAVRGPATDLAAAHDADAALDVALGRAQALLRTTAEYRRETDQALGMLADGEVEELEVRSGRMLEQGNQMTDLWDEVVADADRWAAGASLASELAAAGLAMEEASAAFLPSFNTPGVDNSGVREQAWATATAAVDTLAEVASVLRSEQAEVAGRIAAADDLTGRNLRIAVVGSALVLAVVVLALRHTTLVEHRDQRARDAERDQERARNAFEMELRNGLEMAATETDAHRTVERALATVAPELCADVLMADSSRTHVETVASRRTGACSGCPVGSPTDCPAVRRGHVLSFASSEDLDACPFLRDRPEGAVGAVCIPMSIGSQTSGVLHVTTPNREVPPSETVALLESIARASSDRLGMLRAMARSEAQAATDPLTGLLNRRSLDDRAQSLHRRNVPFAVGFGDLDHFKRLNDLHGHETGDRALRLFSQVLAAETRPTDVVARYGGEEFVLVLPECTAGDAIDLLERVRRRLAEQIPAANLPNVTVSFGVCEWDGAASVREVIERADRALLDAKAAGRDTIVVADGLHAPDLGTLLDADPAPQTTG